AARGRRRRGARPARRAGGRRVGRARAGERPAAPREGPHLGARRSLVGTGRGPSASLRTAFRRAGPEALGAALEAIARRARRDLLRMADYYASLDAEMARAVERARSPEERTRRDAKRRLLPQDLEARRAQLRDRLAARLGAELVAATVVETEVDACEIPVRRRARSTTLVLRRRAGDGVLEGPACASCAKSALHLHVC